MSIKNVTTIIPAPADFLKNFTDARVSLGRCGSSVPTDELLNFNLCHARARDAVHIPLDFDKTAASISSSAGMDVIMLESMAVTREEYLRRPDLGRRVAESQVNGINPEGIKYDISISVADGLSSMAIDKSAALFLSLFIKEIRPDYTLAPVAVIKHGRVAIADEVAHSFNAELAIILIGERPGLKSPDSMGIYMTYNPVTGITDERRNCISNIRPRGLSYEAGVTKLLYLVDESMKRKISGVELKDEQTSSFIENSGRSGIRKSIS
jgi:ethanolamine ammonia-lyase small subunit